MLGNSLKKLKQPNLVTIFVGIALGVLLGSIPLMNVPQPVKLGLAGGRSSSPSSSAASARTSIW